MTTDNNERTAELSSTPDEEVDHYFSASSIGSLRRSGCKLVNSYLPGYDPGSDAEEVFGITSAQFDRAFELEWIRRGRPENIVVQSLYSENERLRAELTKIGLMIDSACYGRKRADEPANLTRRLDMVRKLSKSS